MQPTAKRQNQQWVSLQALLLRRVSLRLIGFLLGFTAATLPGHAQVFYAIENLDTKAVMRRDVSSSATFNPGSMEVGAVRFRRWVFDPATGRVGFSDFSPTNGSVTTSLLLPKTPDSDGDGLCDDAEFILGSSPSRKDTRGDGISDGEAIRHGLNPVSGTGILDSTDLYTTAPTTQPGDVVGVDCFNDIMVVASSDSRIDFYNIFNRMRPRLMASVGTPGPPRAISGDGLFLAVACGAYGLACYDLTRPWNPRPVHLYWPGSDFRTVTVVGRTAYASLASGEIVAVDMPSGLVLQRTALGAPVESMTAFSQTLFLSTSNRLHVMRLDTQPLVEAGSVLLPDTAGAGVSSRRLFADGSRVWVLRDNGFHVVTVTNPAMPQLTETFSGASGWRQMMVDESGNVLALAQSNRLSMFITTNSALPLVPAQELNTLEEARTFCLYNGLAYTATRSLQFLSPTSSTAGLKIRSLHYRPMDGYSRPPQALMRVTPSNGQVERGSALALNVEATDDVQMRGVEFFVNGRKVIVDGNFPFHQSIETSGLTNLTNFTFSTVTADGAGNIRRSETAITLLRDVTPPAVIAVEPEAGMAASAPRRLRVLFSEPMSAASMTGGVIQITSGGLDQMLGSGDDFAVTNFTASYDAVIRTLEVVLNEDLPTGPCRAVVGSLITDTAGNPLTNSFAWQFTAVPAIGEPATKIALSSHVAAIRQDGSLWTWGLNSSRQLGHSPTSNQVAVPTRVGTDNDWRTVAVAGGQMLALRSNRGLWAWGANSFGQLGVGDTVQRSTPTQVGTDQDWAAVSPASDHCFALKTNGSLWAWGNSPKGLLGLGGDSGVITSPNQIGTDMDWRMVTAGEHCGLAIKRDGSLWTWGTNGHGQLGFSTFSTNRPIRVFPQNDWSSVSTHGTYSVGLDRLGRVWVWGTFGYDGFAQARYNEPKRIGNGEGWIATSSGASRLFLIKADGTAWYLYPPAYGTATGSSATPFAPSPLPGFGTCRSIAYVDNLNSNPLANNGAMLRADGSLWVWGRNEYGQLGIGTSDYAYHAETIQVASIAGLPWGIGCMPISIGLVGWWPGDGNGVSLAGTNVAVFHGGAGVGPGYVGTAFQFDGTGYLSLGNSTNMQFGGLRPFSLSAWVKADSQGAIVTKFNSLVEGEWGLYVLPDGRVEFDRSVFPYELVSQNPVQFGQFTHVAATYDGVSKRLYLNGRLEGEQLNGASASGDSTDVLVGAYYNQSQPGLFLNGSIDEVMILGRALSAAEVAAIFTAGHLGVCR